MCQGKKSNLGISSKLQLGKKESALRRSRSSQSGKYQKRAEDPSKKNVNDLLPLGIITEIYGFGSAEFINISTKSSKNNGYHPQFVFPLFSC